MAKPGETFDEVAVIGWRQVAQSAGTHHHGLIVREAALQSASAAGF